MAHYEIHGQAEDLSRLKLEEVNALLIPLMGTTGEIRCLCTTAKPYVRVSRRGSNYFPVKISNTGALHQYPCRHRSLTLTELASMGYTKEALSDADEDELVVKLAKPLKKSSPAPVTQISIFNFKSGQSRNVANQVTELGLLHLLWERARLHEHQPNADAEGLWPKLCQAASSVSLSGFRGLKHGFSDLLLLPLHPENKKQERWNFEKLKDAQSKKRYLLFVACLNRHAIGALLNAEKNDFSLKVLLGVTVTLYANRAAPVLNALKRSFDDALKYSQNDGDDLIVFGIARPDESKYYAQISSLVVMPVVNGHLPYDSSHEKKLALELIRRDRWFKKPLRYDAGLDMVHPDFVLLDTPNPVVIEVYGMSTPEYLARKKEKQSIYKGEEYPYECWDWDAAQFKDLGQWLLNKPLPE